MKPQFIYKIFTDSSFLHSVAWSEDLESLIVVFSSGAIWLYEGIEAEVYESFIAAPSAGKYFNLNIRNLTSGVLLDRNKKAIEGLDFV
jgi:hypothetical protein